MHVSVKSICALKGASGEARSSVMPPGRERRFIVRYRCVISVSRFQRRRRGSCSSRCARSFEAFDECERRLACQPKLRGGKVSEGWRRERDSNPRNPSEFSGFQDHRLKPLGHLSDPSILAGN